MVKSDDESTIPLLATDAAYEFVSVHRVVGLTTAGLETDQSIGLDDPAAKAVLTINPQRYLAAVDRSKAVGNLAIRAMVGQRGEGEIQKLLDEIVQTIASERAKAHSLPAACIVVCVSGRTTTIDGVTASDLGDSVLAFRAVDKEAIKARHHALVRDVLTATALVVDQTTLDVVPIAEGVALTLPDGRPLHSVTISGSAKLSSARPVADADLAAIGSIFRQLRATPSLSTPSRLLADALRSGDDDLQGFVLAWAGLEILIKKHTSGFEDGQWIAKLGADWQPAAQSLHDGFTSAGRKNYRLLEQLEALLFIRRAADRTELLKDVAEIKNQIREPLFHQGTIPKVGFPTERVVRLTRRLMEVILGGASG